MFENKISYPCAIADDTDEGRNAALRWLIDHMEDSENHALGALKTDLARQQLFDQAFE